jgi:hypothetical protein
MRREMIKKRVLVLEKYINLSINKYISAEIFTIDNLIGGVCQC